jgi:hypothetical protein
MMKKLLLSGIAALLLTTGTAYAADREKWDVYWRNCEIRIWFSPEQLQAATRWGVDNEGKETDWKAIAIKAEEIPNLLKAIREIKKCEAWFQCLDDRLHKKVKHCYANDRRWRP